MRAHSGYLQLSAEVRQRNSAQWNLQPFCYPCCWSLCSLWSLFQMTGEFMQWVIFPAPLLSACIALVDSKHRSDRKCLCQRQGRGFRFVECLSVYIWITPDSNCMARHVFQLCSLFLLWHSTAVEEDPLHPWGKGRPGMGGGICVQQPRTGKTRTKGLNPHPQLIMRYYI